MTGDAFAFSDRANDQRRDKAVALARWLFAHGITPEDGNLMSEDERKDAERRAGRARGEGAKPLTTNHRDLLWSIALGALGAKYRHLEQHPQPPYEGAEVIPLVPCDVGCHEPIRQYPCGLRCPEHAPAATA